METIAVINEKGGVGKTTTVATLGHALARRGRSVLAVDLDPQANLTSWLGLDTPPRATIAHALIDHRGTAEAIDVSAAAGVQLLYGSRSAADAADDLRASSPAPATALRRVLRSLTYDYVLLDCPPGLGTLSVNALCAADRLLVPIDSQAMALSGLDQLTRSLTELSEHELLAVVPSVAVFLTRYDRRLGLAREVRAHLRDLDGVGLIEATVRISTRLAECYYHRKTIYDYAPTAAAADDYTVLAAELDA